MPLDPKKSKKVLMHELKATRKSTTNPSRKSAKKHGTSHAQDVAIMLNAKGESNKGVPKNKPAMPVKGTKKAAKHNPAKHLPGRQKKVKP